MKVLIPMFEIQDYGGITGHTELLMRGLKEAGHEVRLVILRNNDQPAYIKKPTGPDGCYRSETGGMVHLLYGWYGVTVMSYGKDVRAKQFVRFAQGFDHIIWSLPCPYNNEGAWRKLFTSSIPQVACIHDAHYERAYTHLADVADYLNFIAPVNESAYGAVFTYPGQKRLINNGHVILGRPTPYHERSSHVVCAHVWKAWKNMHRVVAAAPHTKTSHVIMGGDGIEGRYMRSKNKCKPKYMGLWDAYCASDHDYMGILTPVELFRLYRHSRVMIDLSWNERFAGYGCHYNRSIVEGANHGCIPLLTEEFMEGSNVFPGDTFIGVSKDAGPEDLAETIDMAADLAPQEADYILEHLHDIISNNFDYKVTCLQYLETS